MLKLTWNQAAAWRSGRHHLDRRAPAGSMLSVASRICGLHAQVMSSAELAVWARVEGADRRDVQRALWEDRSLIKTWAMRGTLHLLPASELAIWHGALGTSRRYLRPAGWKRAYGITIEELDRLTGAIATALDGRLVTREELAQEVARLMGSAAFGAKVGENSWGTLLRPAAFAGHLCFAPSVGQRVRFTRPHTWLAGTDHKPGGRMDPDAATAEVARRFLAAYGPATCHDLARWWNGGGIATARQWIGRLHEEVCEVDLEGTRAWMLAADTVAVRAAARLRSVRLLPLFDPYVVGASYHAERLLPGDLRARVYRPQGWISAVLLVNGRMEGTWSHEIRGSRVEVTVEPFVKQAAWVRKAAGEEAERLAAFLGGSLKFAWNR
jgi:uncharacterized protein YcaQ